MSLRPSRLTLATDIAEVRRAGVTRDSREHPMPIPVTIRIAATAFVFAAAVSALPSIASAQANVMKECGAEYQAAKAANTLNGQKWQDFLSACRARHAGGASSSTAAEPAPPATAPATPATAAAPAAPASAASSPAPSKAAAPASGGRAALQQRQRACGAEWKAQKVELRKANPGLKWPQYWSACNKRLKAAGQ